MIKGVEALGCNGYWENVETVLKRSTSVESRVHALWVDAICQQSRGLSEGPNINPDTYNTTLVDF